ncbi:hypothetical protein [Flavobacterium sp. 245]|uniref:hypothetical protein n=1 Tax=Flavobacterium sp. 245 TaxID=2512115 RepID=UPI00105DBD6A|nr:hypothetical protein [Flavobacterium sp. 245]TDP03197.1 hypothetical protein EV145_102360 [Flavobacterium sp. 245]
MKLPKDEKKFWQRHYGIKNRNDIPVDWDIFKAVDSDCDDEFIYFLSLRVLSIEEIHLKETLVTSEGVKYMCGFKNLKTLYLRKHVGITKSSIPYFNEMKDLESLNITKTNITLSDLCENLNNQSLREVFLSSGETEENITEKGFILKERMPKCDFYLNTSFTTTVFDHPIKPIF